MARGSEVYNNSGKIGKCFYSNGVNTIKIKDIISDFYQYNEYSLSVWCYIESQNTSHSGSAIISGGDWNSQVINLAVSDWSSDHYTRLRISGTNWNKWYPYNFYLNTWYHIVVECNQNRTLAYVNGLLIGDTSDKFLPTAIQGNDICIGGATYYAGMQFFGKINDVRIYDHALSPFEVKQISQGLILHYPLNRNGWGQENLLPCGGQYTKNNPWSTTLNRTDGYAWVTNSAFQAIPSTTYTISVECDGTLSDRHAKGSIPISDKPFTFWLYICNTNTSKSWESGAYDSAINLTSANYNYKKIGNVHTWQYTLSSTQKYISLRTNLYSDGSTNITVNWWNMKIEKGDVFTSWCPNSTDKLATTLGLNDNIQYDTSGYNHNLKNFNKFSFSSDTPKYNVSTELAGTSYGTHQYLFLNDNYQKELTVSCWIKRTFSENVSRYISNSWVVLYLYSDFTPRISWKNSTGESDILNTWAPGGVIPINTWTHICFTIKDGIIKYYKNGTYISTSDRTRYGTLIHGSLSNGFGGESLTSKNWIGGLSDFRFYCTALSAEDVLALYKNSVYLDNEGNLYGAELREV